MAKTKKMNPFFILLTYASGILDQTSTPEILVDSDHKLTNEGKSPNCTCKWLYKPNAYLINAKYARAAEYLIIPHRTWT